MSKVRIGLASSWPRGSAVLAIALALFASSATLVMPIALLLTALPSSAQGQFRERLRQRMQSRQSENSQFCKIAGLDVAVWQPLGSGPFPLVVFSHGFHGRNTQSEFLMSAMAKAGYLVVAPNHRDAAGGAVQVSFRQPKNWSEATYRDRGEDITKLLSALQRDSNFNTRIDWSKVALAGHSLGGYTVLGLAGAWPTWKLPGVKAVIAMSPYCQPYLAGGNLSSLGIPVMYQGGTRDFGITPSVKKESGAFATTGSPAYFVEFDKIGHLGWTTFNHDSNSQQLIGHYCLAFLDRYLKGNESALLNTKLAGVSDLRAK
jgi:pimeloyl-ACP methyl ester carboxylesterase